MIEEEKRKYELMWKENSYRVVSPGYNATLHFFEHFKGKIALGDSLIDFGCGTGAAASVFLPLGLQVQLVDIASNCLDEQILHLMRLLPGQIIFHESTLWDLSQDIAKADWIYCCDVLEHIPEMYIDAALSQMAEKCKKGGFFQIALQEEPFGDLIDMQLHLTLQPKEWWIQKLQTFFSIDAYGPEDLGFRFSVFVFAK